jgi:hypothetical protein
MSGKAINLIGQTFGRATVVARNGTIRERAAWRCQCSCGNEFTVNGVDLRSGNTSSCGCWGRESRSLRATKHGHARDMTGAYRSWLTMRARCLSPNATGYENYGGRGIKICDRWNSYEKFFDDMGERPPKQSLERIDPDGNYELSNCIWIPWSEQSANTRATVWTRLNGERMHQAEAARRLGVNAARLLYWHKNDAVPEGVDLVFEGGSKGETSRREILSIREENDQLRAVVATLLLSLQLIGATQ